MEFYWLLETIIDNRVAYFHGKGLHSGKSECTFDAVDAVRFSSKEEAESSEHFKSQWHAYRATEHGFDYTIRESLK